MSASSGRQGRKQYSGIYSFVSRCQSRARVLALFFVDNREDNIGTAGRPSDRVMLTGSETLKFRSSV